MSELPNGFDDATLREALDVAIAAADAAARIHRGHQGGPMGVRTKSTDIDLVTEVDTLSEEAIRSILAERYPDHAFLGEETGQDVEARCRWIVDPLDGTVNYAHGFPFYCVSIALEVDSQVLVAVVQDTAHGERFTAMRSHGAFVDGRRLRVSETTDPRESMVSTGFSYDAPTIERNLPVLNRVLPRTRGLRRAGAAALDLCYVAAGRVDAFWEYRLNAWDVAAGMLMVREAGGSVTGEDGSPYRWDHQAMLASNGAVHAKLMDLLGLDRTIA